ncbi:kexin KEX2 KNAG_0F00770 [Huiozyma naganishii CBS 8797]|uniref:P/Homo B domain-containing protein n=1 Tax=Huiozyma naganishii (strain ATCC MYA-139 / BCRC 22969 / CBS 8797 / KCTC 17520 / NBRC 10181 / NCYC 3082 / Yp74L-3) TaxID=1071383 RepID=J7S878_HUIN7|nr:hypothetical protein KNAG_0F00770 [Kazachstania naganishii CBS 8797]CCK70746.1 hypothetical protein KNAG_0F00770 [Kazachstania naganishii CBS 8797]
MWLNRLLVCCWLALLSVPGWALDESSAGLEGTETQLFVIESVKSVDELLSAHPQWKFERDVSGLQNHYVFSQDMDGSLQKRSDYSDSPDVLYFENLVKSEYLFKRSPLPIALPVPVPAPPYDSSMIPLKEAEEKLEINDPNFEKQWHLINANYPGNDVNVKDVWYGNVTGSGVVVAIVDDGVDYENPDIADNFCAEGSWDFNDNTTLPKPRLADDYHGTRCAGEIAASKNNGFCGIGVAYNSKVSGLRILSGPLTPEDEAASLMYALDVNDIFSCSWGPQDDGRHLQGPSELVRKALIKGVTEGRQKKGSVYVFASGNGGHFGDNCNYDGYTNSIYSITIGAIDHKGLHPPYSESCSAVMAVTYSSGSGEFIHSTDINDQCSDRHGGTSAAAPLAAGIYALLLEANPELTWRDVQYLSILSSKEITNPDAFPQSGAMGRKYSHTYGYGRIDASELVTMAKSWKNVKPQAWYFSELENVSGMTNRTDNELKSTISVTEDNLKDSNLERVEHVTITVDIEADIRGPITVDLVSPSGIVSYLGVERNFDQSPDGFRSWTFMSVAHWGETGIGEWKLSVKTKRDGNTVKLNTWKLKLFGESIDPSKAVPYEYNMGKDPDEVPKPIAISQLGSNTATATSQTAENTAVVTTTTTSPSSSVSEAEHSKVNKLPSPRQAMHYFISLFVVAILLFLVYFFIFVKSRRRIRRSRAEAYEFDIIDTDSDYDSTMDSRLSSNMASSGMQENTEIDDFDFDLSDEDNLVTPADHSAETPQIDYVLNDSSPTETKKTVSGEVKGREGNSGDEGQTSKEAENPFFSPDDPTDTKQTHDEN